MSNFLSKYIGGDRSIWVIALLLGIISLLVVYSSIVTLAYKYQSGNTLYYLIKHGFILFIGFIFIYLAHKVDHKNYYRFAKPIYILSILLLIYTLFNGANINEASRWIYIPIINQTFQTSDLGKLALYIFTARTLAKYNHKVNEQKFFYLNLLLPVLLTCGLILPSNFSTAALVFFNSLVLMKIGGVRWKYILTVIGSGIIAFALFITIVWNFAENKGRIGTWKKRIETFIEGGDKDSNYQVEQAKIAIARGGWVGQLPGNSIQRNFLPHPYSDFIFAILLEEYGFFFGLLVMGLYIILLVRGLRIAMRAPTPFGSYLAFILSFSIVLQAFVNIGVTVNIFPVTGQPLPLVSMGGTSIWFTCLTLGILLSIANQNQESTINTKTEVAYA